MASISSHSPVGFTGSLASGSSSASEMLRSSTNGVGGVPLKTLGRERLGMNNRKEFSVSAKLRKVKKHEYPWPEDADPNVRGGVLSHLSSFKPLKEKPKPVTLDFEKPLMDLQKKIVDVCILNLSLVLVINCNVFLFGFQLFEYRYKRWQMRPALISVIKLSL